MSGIPSHTNAEKKFRPHEFGLLQQQLNAVLAKPSIIDRGQLIAELEACGMNFSAQEKADAEGLPIGEIRLRAFSLLQNQVPLGHTYA